MQENLQNKSEEYVKKNRKRNVWKRVVQILACVVVFCTTYALILPAITMEQKSYCGYEEHMHTQKCYREIPVASELMCPLVEGEVVEDELPSVSDSDATDEIIKVHAHTEDCYDVPKVAPLTCSLEENEEHSHDFLCYGTWELTCTKEAHTHSLACFSDPQADVESEAVWENMVWHMDLSGIWTDDIVAIAKSQLGYKESATNYQVNEDTSVNGYTRYGAWAQEPYGDWEAAFAAFCVYYAEVEGMPLEADTALWQQELQKAELYHAIEAGYEPKSGDLLFMDTDKDGNADLVAVVCETVAATEEAGAGIKVIQGNVSNQVQYVTYDALDEAIMGYGVMPNQPNPVRSYTYADEKVWVKVKLPADTTVPKDAQLQVTAIAPESTQYAELLSQAQAAVDQNVVQAQFYDISFYTVDCEYIAVSEKARVMMRFAEDVVDPRDKTVVLHYENETEAPIVLEDVSVVEEDPATTMTLSPGQETTEYTNTLVSYETEGFSVFGLVEIETTTNGGNGNGEGNNNNQGSGNGGGNGNSGNGNEEVITETYVTSVPNAIVAADLYNFVKDAGSKIFIIHGNLQHQQDKNLTSTIENNILKLRDIKEKEGFNSAGFSSTGFNVISFAYPDQLWRFTAREQENTYFIESVNQPGMYLSLVTIDNKQVFSISEEKQLVEITFAEAANYHFKLSIDGKSMRWNYNNEFEASSDPSSGIFLSEYTGSLVEPDVGGGEVNPEEPDIPEEPEIPETPQEPDNSGERVINLGGKTLMLLAVNSNSSQYAGVTSTSNGAGLQSSTLTNVAYNNGDLTIEDDDVNNNMAFEFVESGTPGYYYIKAANFYGTPSNSVAGKYWNINQNSIEFTDYQQPIEVVKASVSDQDDIEEAICLRVNHGGNDYYLQLENNTVGSAVISTANNNTITNTANHFAVAELIQEDKTAVEDLREMIDALPNKQQFTSEVNALSTFAEQIEYRKEKREVALEVKAAIDELSSQQLNFVGKERVDKLLTELEFLWRPDPNIVPAVDLNATVKVFNYGADINDNHPLGINDEFLFYSWDNADKIVDAKLEVYNNTEPIMRNKLDENSPYPVIEQVYKDNYYQSVQNGNLDYLFDGTYQVGNAMTDGGGLFQLDKDGYYYYYADTNAAWFDPVANEFVLYDVVVKPEYALQKHQEAPLNNDTASNFFPFNEVIGNVIYDDVYNNGKVVSSVDKETTVDTAYLNAKTDLWFGMTIEYDFFIPKGRKVDGKEMIFEFHGDDDVFVYIDDVLVLDMGGAHEARDGKINFTTGEVVYDTDNGTQYKKLATLINEAGVDVKTDGDTLADYTMHNLKFFYLERGGTYSYAGIKFNMPALPENTLSVGKDIDVDGSYIDAQLDYTFRLASVNGNGEVTDESFLLTGKSFDIYDMATQVDTGRDGKVNDDGTFTLKAGELAVFPNLLEVVDVGKKHFVVQEILPDSVKGQYDNITYEVNGGEPISLAVVAGNADGTHGYITNKPEEGRTTYQTDVYSTDSGDGNFAHRFEFTNNVDENKLDTLNIKKLAAEGSNIDPNKEFQIKVNVGNDAGSLIQLPKDTPYTTNGEIRTVGENGIITLKIGETATIKGFLAGTYWEIEEILGNEEKYIPTYAGTSQNGSSIIINGNAGTFGVGNTGDTVDFTVTNQLCDVLLQVPLSKTAIGNTDSATFHFDVERGTWQDGTWTTLETKSDTSITISDATKTNFTLPLSILNSYSTPVYYKISERNSGSDFIYDDTYYIVEVTVTASGNGNEAAITNIWKNGTEVVGNASSLDFVNYKTNDVTISKKVINLSNKGDQGGEFPFEARIRLNGEDFKEITSGTNYTVDGNGVIRFNLKDTESVTIPVPVNGTLTVTETNNAGYQTSYQVTKDGVEETVVNGTSVIVTDIVGPARIDFTNQTGYELPATGGSGTHGYIWCGLLMILAAAGLLFYQRRAKRNN